MSATGGKPDVSGYDWLEEESAIQSAGCVSVVTGSTREAVAAAFGADLEQEVTFGRKDGRPDGGQAVVAVVVPDGADGVDGAVLVVEDGGTLGHQKEVLEAASATGLAASVFWDLDAVVYFSCARHGRLLYSEEIMNGETTGLPKELLPWIALVASDIEDVDDEPGWVSVAAAMVEKLTGVPIRPEQVAVTTGFRVVGPDALLA